MSVTMTAYQEWPTRRSSRQKSMRDSLSPKREYLFVGQYGKDDGMMVEQTEHEVEVEPETSVVKGKNDSHDQHSHFTSLSTKLDALDMTTIPASMTAVHVACSPRYALARSHRPFELEFHDSRGATSVSSSELRSLIKQTAASGGTRISSRIQVYDPDALQTPVVKSRKRYPQPPPLHDTSVNTRSRAYHPRTLLPQPTLSMGNQQSHHSYGSQPRLTTSTASFEDQQYHRTAQKVHNNRPVSVLSKRIVSKPVPVAHKLTTTVIEVPRAATAPNLDLIDDNDPDWEDEQHSDKESKHIRHVKTLSEPAVALLSHPASPATITEELAARPLSAGTTITGLSVQSREDTSSPDALRISALSPTLPAPSPVPEDSPHQYGLKDFTNTPSPPQDATKLKRRSNGIDIFNEAKNLQSAASFLNGLSNARRRAESRARSRRASVTKAMFPNSSTTSLPNGNPSSSFQSTPAAYRSLTHLPLNEPGSPPSVESRPVTPRLDDLSRTLGHTHKSSGFAYAKPLSLTQLKCYRNHERLLRSGNKIYQVECAVCHKDEPEDYYWSCSWCAIRMCEGCRSAFRKQGMKALKEKIRDAEYGCVPA